MSAMVGRGGSLLGTGMLGSFPDLLGGLGTSPERGTLSRISMRSSATHVNKTAGIINSSKEIIYSNPSCIQCLHRTI